MSRAARPNVGTNWPAAVMPTQPLTQRKHMAAGSGLSSTSRGNGRGGRSSPTSRKIFTTGSQSMPSQWGQESVDIVAPFQRIPCSTSGSCHLHYSRCSKIASYMPRARITWWCAMVTPFLFGLLSAWAVADNGCEKSRASQFERSMVGPWP
jgi:hypothetical protein